MRSTSILLVAACGLLLAGCESDQPLTHTSGNIAVDIRATASSPSWYVWDWSEDANGDGQLTRGETDVNGNGQVDPFEDFNSNGQFDQEEDTIDFNGQLDIGVWCEPAGPTQVDGTGAITGGVPGLAPLRFSGEILLFRAGQTDPVVLARSEGTPGGFTALTPYDERVFGAAPQVTRDIVMTFFVRDPSPPPEGPDGFFFDKILHVTNGQNLLGAHPRVMNATRSLSPALSPDPKQIDTIEDFAGYCVTGFGFPSPSIGGVALPVRTTAGAGDTIVVRAQKSPNARSIFLDEPEFLGQVTSDGSPLDLKGTVTTTEVSGGISFSATLR